MDELTEHRDDLGEAAYWRGDGLTMLPHSRAEEQARVDSVSHRLARSVENSRDVH